MTIDTEEQKKLLRAKHFVSGEENQTISQMPLPSGLRATDCGVIMKDMMLTDISYPEGEVPTKNDFSGGGRAFMMTIPFRNPMNEVEIKTDLLAVCEDACGCKVDNFRAVDFYQFQDMVKIGEQQYRAEIDLRDMALKDKDATIEKKEKQIKEERGDRNFDDDIWRKRVANLRKTATKDKLGEDADYKKMIDMSNEMGELGNSLRDAEDTIEKQKRVMENLTRSIKEKDDQIELAKKTMEEATTQIITLDKKITELKDPETHCEMMDDYIENYLDSEGIDMTLTELVDKVKSVDWDWMMDNLGKETHKASFLETLKDFDGNVKDHKKYAGISSWDYNCVQRCREMGMKPSVKLEKKSIDRDIRCGAFDIKTTWGYVVDMLDSIGYTEELRVEVEGEATTDNTDEIVEECCGVIDWTINKYSEGATNGETLNARIYDNVSDRCRELVDEGKMMELVEDDTA